MKELMTVRDFSHNGRNYKFRLSADRGRYILRLLFNGQLIQRYSVCDELNERHKIEMGYPAVDRLFEIAEIDIKSFWWEDYLKFLEERIAC